MIALVRLLLTLLASSLRSKVSLKAENAPLRQQIIVLRRKLRGRAGLSNGDRLFFVWLYRLFPSILRALIIPPDTLVRWHREGFRRYWRWKSRLHIGRPPVERDLRALIRQMSAENASWGAPRIHGELLKLGFEVAQSTVAKYMIKWPRPRSQTWLTFLRNHAPDIAASSATRARVRGLLKTGRSASPNLSETLPAQFRALERVRGHCCDGESRAPSLRARLRESEKCG